MRIPLLLAVVLLSQPGCSVMPTTEAARGSRPAFKGIELYSWQDPATQKWRFVLLAGTNRIKTPAEIMAGQAAIGSVEALKEQLSRLAPEESVFWLVPDSRFALPPPAIVAGIVRHAAGVDVALNIVE